MAYRPQVLTVPNGGTGAITLTNHGVVIGQAASAVAVTAAGSAGQVLQSGGASANPSYSTATFPSTSGTSGNFITSDGTNFVSSTQSIQGYTLQMMTIGGAPQDATTYFMQMGQALTTSSASGSAIQQIVIPRAGTITACFGMFTITPTVASNENTTVAIRLNNTTNINVTTTAQLTASPTVFGTAALSQAVSAGDFLEVIMICPTWATNPLLVSTTVTIYVS